jgi:DNA-binding MarR family transcriptional regulator
MPWMPDRVRHDEKRLRAVFIVIFMLNYVTNQPTALTESQKKSFGPHFFLDKNPGWFYFVDTMNDFYPTSKEQVARYQAKRLQDLIGDITQCCQEKTLYQANKFGLTQAEMKCLLLFKEERYLTVKGLAQKLEVAKSRVTRIIDGLVKKRLAQRIDDPEDARVILISLTPEGQKQVEALDVFLKDLHHQLLRELKEDDRKNVLASLETLRSSMEVVKQQLV